jgi:sialate O-acetylesterase
MPALSRPLSALAVACLCLVAPARADVALNNMFGDHMVLQRGIKNKIWGRADPG